MPDSIPYAVRVDSVMLAKLDELARQTNTTRAWVLRRLILEAPETARNGKLFFGESAGESVGGGVHPDGIMDDVAFGQAIRLLRQMMEACPRSSIAWKMLNNLEYRTREWDQTPQEVRHMVQLLSEAKTFLDTWETKL